MIQQRSGRREARAVDLPHALTLVVLLLDLHHKQASCPYCMHPLIVQLAACADLRRFRY